VYAARRALVLDHLQRELAPWLEAVPSDAGLHVAAVARTSVDIDAVVAHARAQEVGVYPLYPYYFDGPARAGLMFGYGDIAEDEIREGLARLRRAFERTSRR
jgi:GntR family transcriptional regulator/MocR family aminotransferase